VRLRHARLGSASRKEMRLRKLARDAIRRVRFDARRARYHFIHIPKNAGQSVRDALYLQPDVSLSNPYHYRYVDIADQVGRHLTHFAVVRNPWSRTASRFHFARQNSGRWPADDPRREFIANATFADFVKEQRILPIPEHPGQPWMGPLNSWFNQLEWLRDERGFVACHCLRLEYLEDELAAFLKRPIRLRRENATRTRYDYRSMYTDELMEIIGSLFREDIEYFGFSFGGPATKNVFALS
jgi:hypothetical protein